MGRKKLEKIPDLDKAEARIAALKSIDPALDMGDGRDIKSYQEAITKGRTSVGAYNQALSDLDGLYNKAIADIKSASTLSGRMLSGVGSKWGTDSDNYEKAGGTRTSERKKPGRKPKTT